MTARPLILRGAGGGGGAYEQTDTLRSTQIADILDLISEGECQGLVDGLKSIYLDGVPLQAPDGSMNFQGVQVSTTPGTQGQVSIAGADDVENEIAVGVTVLFATPLVRSIASASIDTCRVTIVVPQLSSQNPDNGDLVGTTVEWAIDVQSAGGGYVQVFTEEIAGKTMSSYPRAVEFKLPGSAPWDIRVRRVTADSGTVTLVNAFGWSSYTEIQTLKLRYPHSCLVRTRVGAQQFARIPVRGFDWLGLRIQVPVNYDPLTRVYTGVWDGTFKIAWTDNAAWIFHDIVKQNRYGLGHYVATTDAFKWDIYAIGQYCDALVPDGYGGMEPRFRASPQLETREQAYKVLADMAAIFMGMAYWSNTDIAVVQDAPGDPVAVFTPANVVPTTPGRFFTYTGASNAKRYSQVMVWFNNLPDRGKLVPEVVVDQALVAAIGVKTLELSPLGIWSRGQAQRVGKWALYSQENQTEGVSFKVGLDGVLVAPGRYFQIADPNEAGERLAGRVQSATTTVVTLDAAVVLAGGESYLLTVMLQDPANPAKLMTQQRAVSTAAGTTNTITVGVAFTSAPAAESVWLLQSEAVEATNWRCVGLTEDAGANTFTINAIAHAPQKYDLIEQGIAFERPSVSRLTVAAPKPTPVSLTETPYRSGSITVSRVTVSWVAPARGLTYVLAWRLNNGPWTHLPPTSANSVEMDGLAKGLFDVVVSSRNALGNDSQPEYASLLLVGKTTRPQDVAAFTYEVVGGGVKFTWTPNPEDTYMATTLKIGAVILFEGAASSWTWAWPAPGTYTVNATHWDTSINESLTPSPVTVVVNDSMLLQFADLAAEVSNAIDAAAAAAAGASASAATANAKLAEIASDTLLTPGEKPDVVREHGVLTAEQAGIDAQAVSYAIVTEKNAYDAAVTALTVYLATLTTPTLWSNTTGNTTIVQATFTLKFGDVYATRQAVLNAISASARARLMVRPNLLKNGGFENGKVGWTVTMPSGGDTFVVADSAWGRHIYATSVPNGTGVVETVPFPVYGGATYLVHGDSAIFGATITACYFDIVFLDAGGSVPSGGDGPQNSINVAHDFSVTDANRAVHAVAAVAPATAVTAIARFVWNGTGITTVAARQIKVELGGFPYTGYSNESAVTAAHAAAATATANAAAAQSSADTANAGLATIANDNVLSKGEKAAVILDWVTLANEQTGIDAQAAAYAITTERTAYNNALAALAAYLTSLSPNWGDTSQDTPISGATFRTNFGNAYLARQALLNKIAQVAGTVAAWAGISGVGKPADNATSDLALVARGQCVVVGNRAQKVGGSSAWDSDTYSRDSYTGGAFASASPELTTAQMMFGLNSDPLSDQSYTSLDFAFYFNSAGGLEIYESGAGRGSFGAYAVGDVFVVTYDGANVVYMKNGAVLRTVSAASGLTFFWDSSIADPGAALKNIRFGPMSPVTGIGTTQIVDGAITTTQVYFDAAGVNICPAC